jgi:hypothetical protein
MVREYAAEKERSCMKNRIGWPRAALAAVAVITVTLGLSAGVASASTARPAGSATAVTRIHEAKCTGTTVSVRYDDAKKVACYSRQEFLKAAFPALSQSTATLTVAASGNAAFISDALPASVRPDGGSCHSFGWQVWKDYCAWTFTHAQSVALVRAAITGGRAAVAAVCTGLLHKFLGHLVAPVCAAFAGLFGVLKKEKLDEHQCVALKVYIVPPRPSFAIVKC